MRRLHLHNGDSVAATAREAGIDGEHVPWRESLVTGNVAHCGSDAAWAAQRAEALSAAFGVDRETCAAEILARCELLARAAEFDEVVLWFEADLFCQSILTSLLHRLSKLHPVPTHLFAVASSFDERHADVRLGRLGALELRDLDANRCAITAAEVTGAAHAWDAFASSDPAHLDAFVGASDGSLPLVRRAWAAQAARYPSMTTGLGTDAERILELATGHSTANEIVHAFLTDDTTLGYGDTHVWLELRALAGGAHPLVTIERAGEAVSPDDPRCDPETSISVTAAGRSVLDNGADAIAMNCIDRWLGGVHLAGDQAAWRRDPQTNRLTPIEGRGPAILPHPTDTPT